MDYIDFKNKTKKTNVLGGIDILGSFDFYTSIITLDALSSFEIENFRRAFFGWSGKSKPLELAEYEIFSKTLPLIVHEYTHFIDATSNLWGLRHLQLMDAAYTSAIARETEFYQAKLFFDHCRRLRLPDYYTVVEKGISPDRPWKWTPTIGKSFDPNGRLTDKPVLFVRFANCKEQLLARSPLSLISLLESSAMAQELNSHASLLTVLHEDARIVEQKHFSQRTIDYLHDPHITEYSVCAHLVANVQGCTNGIEAFEACHFLVGQILNFPDQVFEQVADSALLAAHLGIAKDDHPFVQSFRSGIRGKDRGMLFYLLTLALPPGSTISGAMLRKGFKVALKRIGITHEKFVELRDKEVDEVYSTLCESKSPTIQTLAKAGYANFRQIASNDEVDFFNLNLPPAMLKDSTKFQMYDGEHNQLRCFDIDACFDELYRGQSWVQRFAEACI